MVDAVEVGDVDFKVFADGGIGIGAVLAVGDGLIAVEERRPLTRESQHGIVGVVNAAVDVQVDEIDVPVVLVAAVAGQRRVDDACVVVEAEIEVVLKELHVANGYHHLLEKLAVVLHHETVQPLAGHAPDVVPSGVGNCDENRIAGYGNFAFSEGCQRVSDDGEHS